VVLAFAVSLLAGLATSVGGLLAVHRVLHRRDVLSVALAFAAGAMLTVSVAEILPRGFTELRATVGAGAGLVLTLGAFALGAVLVLLIDRVLPTSLNPAEIAGGEDTLSAADQQHNIRLLRSGAMVAGIVALHNVPEGLSTFVSTLEDPRLGISLGVAIAIHNVPEGIAVAAPVYAATGSRRRAFWWATASGVAEPFGALLGFALLALVLPEHLFTFTFGLIGGMMVLVSLKELIPAARRYQQRAYATVVGLLAGCAVMLLSLALLG